MHGSLQVELRVLMEPSWAVLEFELASALHGVVKKYWRSQQIRRELIFRPMPQVWLACCSKSSCNSNLIVPWDGSCLTQGFKLLRTFAERPASFGAPYASSWLHWHQSLPEYSCGLTSCGLYRKVP